MSAIFQVLTAGAKASITFLWYFDEWRLYSCSGFHQHSSISVSCLILPSRWASIRAAAKTDVLLNHLAFLWTECKVTCLVTQDDGRCSFSQKLLTKNLSQFFCHSTIIGERCQTLHQLLLVTTDTIKKLYRDHKYCILMFKYGKNESLRKTNIIFIHLGICSIYLQYMDICASLPNNLKEANFHREVKVANFSLPQNIYLGEGQLGVTIFSKLFNCCWGHMNFPRSTDTIGPDKPLCCKKSGPILLGGFCRK